MQEKSTMEQSSKNVLEEYYLKLVLKKRDWNGILSDESEKIRKESISEHIHGAQILAWGIWSEFDLNIDIFETIKEISSYDKDIIPYLENDKQLETEEEIFAYYCYRFEYELSEKNESKTELLFCAAMNLANMYERGIKIIAKEEYFTKIENILDFYEANRALKEKVRTSWIYWNVTGRRESVSEHISSAQKLAMVVYKEFDFLIHIEKVLAMLSLHETEEIGIGDITKYDGISEEEKLSKGNLVVKDICKNLSKRKILIDLIDEFNQKETSEAKFAYWCDKMDCDLQAKDYSDAGRYNLDFVEPKVINSQEVQQAIQNGADTMAKIFQQVDKNLYSRSKVFTEISDISIEYRIPKIYKKL